MRRLFVSFALLLSSLAPAQAQAEPITPKSLVGKWAITVPVANGPAMTTTLSLSGDMKFSGVAKVDDKVYWEYSGRWELKDRQLTWHYERSSKPLPESAKVDIDDVVSVSAKELVLASKVDGKKNVLARVKE